MRGWVESCFKHILRMRPLAFLLAMCILLCGCMATEMSMVFNDDGSGIITVGAYFSDEFLEEMNALGGSTSSSNEDFTEHKMIDGKPYSGATETTAFSSIENLQEMLKESEESDDATSGMSSIDFQQLGNGNVLVTISTVSESEFSSNLGGVDDSYFTYEENIDGDMEELVTAMFHVTVDATFPGGVVNVDAPIDSYTIDGNKITVNLVSNTEAQSISFIGSLNPQSTVKPEVNSVLPFVDVPADSWYTKDLEICYQKGLIGGTSATEFSPNDTLTLAQIITMCARMHGLTGEVTPVEGELWYQPYHNYLVSEGVLNGYEFDDLDRPATRAEMAYIIFWSIDEWEAIKPEIKFSDVSEMEKYFIPITSLQKAGVCAGVSADEFGYYQNVTRAQAAVFMARAVDPSTRK